MKREQKLEVSFSKVLEAGVKAQKLVKGPIAVGGTAAAIWGGHRSTIDSDQMVPDFRERFDDILDDLENSPSWETSSYHRPYNIDGFIGNVMVAFEAPRYKNLIQTATVPTQFGPLVIPTRAETLCLKAFNCFERRLKIDFIDFAVLAKPLSPLHAVSSLMLLPEEWREMVWSSLIEAKPSDLYD